MSSSLPFPSGGARVDDPQQARPDEAYVDFPGPSVRSRSLRLTEPRSKPYAACLRPRRITPSNSIRPVELTTKAALCNVTNAITEANRGSTSG
jgi:hypothetical protein